MRLAKLTRRLLHAELEPRLEETQELLVQFVNGLATQFLSVHHITVLFTNIVGIGSLAAASASASRASSSDTPSTS